MKIGGFGELENLRKAISRDDTSKVNKKKYESAPPASSGKESGDEVQLSGPAKLIGRLNQVPETRQEKVEAIKQQVQSGEYITPEKLKDGIRGMLGGL